MIEKRDPQESAVEVSRRYRAAQQFIAVLNKSRKLMTSHQRLTLKGQALSGDLEGAWRGLEKLLKGAYEARK